MGAMPTDYVFWNLVTAMGAMPTDYVFWNLVKLIFEIPVPERRSELRFVIFFSCQSIKAVSPNIIQI